MVVKSCTPKKLNHAMLKTDRIVLSWSCHDPAICCRASMALSSGRPSPPRTYDRMGSPTVLMTSPQKPYGPAMLSVCQRVGDIEETQRPRLPALLCVACWAS